LSEILLVRLALHPSLDGFNPNPASAISKATSASVATSSRANRATASTSSWLPQPPTSPSWGS